jgi:PAS domain S-box-containing protein
VTSPEPEAFDRLAAVVASSDDAIITKTLDGTITSWNGAATRIFGHAAAEAIGRPMTILFPPHRLVEEVAFLARIARGERVDHFETERVRKDGTTVIVSITLSPVRDPSGRIVEISHIARDITARRQLEAARDQAEQALRDGEVRLAADVDALARMQQVSSRPLEADDGPRLLDEILEAAIEITGADMGTIQLLDGRALRMMAHRGLDSTFLRSFDAVEEGASEMALKRGQRIVIEDVATDPGLARTPALGVLLAAGVRAVQSTPLFGRTGRVLGVFSTHYRAPHRPAERDLRLLDVLARQAADLIERALAEMTLRESEQRFRLMADAAPVLIWVRDLDMSCIWFNAQWLDFVGRTMEQELGKGWIESIHPSDVARCLDVYRSAFHGRRPFQLEYRLRRADGQYRWIVDRGVPRYTGVEEFAGFIGSAIDITEMKETMAALAREIDTTRALFESAAEGIVVVDHSGAIVRANRRLAEMFGYPEGQLVGQPVEMLLPERLRAGHGGRRAEFLSAPRSRSMGVGLDLYGRRSDGVEFPVEISLSPIQTTEGQLVMALVTDISERRNLEVAARQREKLAVLATLSLGIAHELNNPIGIISTRVELMLQEAAALSLPEQVTDDLRVLHRNAQRVGGIARSLLSFARQAPEEPGPVDVNAVIEETLLLVGRPLAKDGVQIRLALDRGLGPIWGNANALQQVLTNLLLNARDAMPRGGDVRIETRPQPGRVEWLQLTVADSGCGMPPEVVERIWEPFYTTKSAGTGLGLAVTRRIIREHGGAIEIQSAPDRGTTFTILLPLRQSSLAT